MNETSDAMSAQTYNETSRRLRENLPYVKDDIDRIARESFPDIRFANIWVRPGRSWFGDAIVDIWTVFEGEVADLADVTETLSFGTRVQHMLWDRGLDVTPSTHFITKSEAGDWRPEGV